MTIRAPIPDDAPDIARIAYENGLPQSWTWPDGHHGLAVEHDGRLVAFAILSENPWGLVTEELWQERSRAGNRGLSLLSVKIEAIAQQVADRRGEPIMSGGVIRLDRAEHIAALRHRGYTDEAVILAKPFVPRPLAAKGDSVV